MKRFNHILIIALGVMLLSSCTKEPLMGGDEPLPKGTVGIQILLPASADTEVQGAGSDAAKAESDAGRTYRAIEPKPPVPGTESENRITNLKFFIAHTAADGKEVIKRIVEVKDMFNDRADPDADAKWEGGDNMLHIRNMKNPDELHTVFVVANWADVPATIVEGAPLETLTGAITHIAAAIPTPDNKHPMVMSGFAVDHNFATTPLVKVPIEHQAARFKLIVATSYAFEQAYKDELVFGDPTDKHISVEVGNTYNSSYVFRQAPPAIPASAAELLISFQMARKVYVPNPDYSDTDIWEFPAEFFLYLYENPVAGITEYAKAHATYFLINIPYYKKNDPTKQLTNNYYKFKVIDDNVNNPNPHAIVRNTSYDAYAIAMGFGSEDPMKAVEIAAEVTVKPWSDIDVNGDITDQKPPINSKLNILTAEPKVTYINGGTIPARIDFWTDRPAAEVRLDPIAKAGVNLDMDINLTDYFEGTTNLHLTTDGVGGNRGYLELTPIANKTLPQNSTKVKINLTAGGIQRKQTIWFSHIVDFTTSTSPKLDLGILTLFDYAAWNGTVANGNNGEYVPNKNAVELGAERLFARLEIASADATTSAVNWATARASCPSGWRLPRAGEFRYLTINDFKSNMGFTPIDGAYWTGTEAGVGSAWSVNFSNSSLEMESTSTPKRVRCVKRVPVPEYVEIVYIIEGAEHIATQRPKSGLHPASSPISAAIVEDSVRALGYWVSNTHNEYAAGAPIATKDAEYIELRAVWKDIILMRPDSEKNLQIACYNFFRKTTTTNPEVWAWHWNEISGYPMDKPNKVQIGIPFLNTGCRSFNKPGESSWRLPTWMEAVDIAKNFDGLVELRGLRYPPELQESDKNFTRIGSSSQMEAPLESGNSSSIYYASYDKYRNQVSEYSSLKSNEWMKHGSGPIFYCVRELN